MTGGGTTCRGLSDSGLSPLPALASLGGMGLGLVLESGTVVESGLVDLGLVSACVAFAFSEESLLAASVDAFWDWLCFCLLTSSSD